MKHGLSYEELATAYDALFDEIKELRRVAVEMRGWLECHDVNHHSGEFHEYDEPCKALARIDAIIAIRGGCDI